MAAQTGETGNYDRPRTGRRTRRLLVALPAGMLLIGGIYLLASTWHDASLEDRIAAINASHAPPPEKNAATLYDALIKDGVIQGDPREANLAPDTIAALIEASEMESCWFPLSPGDQCYRDHVRYLRAMRDWYVALCRAAEDDVAQGRFDAAAQKLRCVIKMGVHLQQQALWIDFAEGAAIQAAGWSYLAEFVMQPDATEETRELVEVMPGDLTADWEQACALVREVQPLISDSILSELPLREKLRHWWLELRYRDIQAILKDRWYQRLVSLRRGVHVLVELRRYRNANGRWPQSLDEIALLVPELALMDPYTGRQFVYRVEGDVPWLYAKGANGVDENGANVRGGPDDWRIWPPYRYRTRTRE